MQQPFFDMRFMGAIPPGRLYRIVRGMKKCGLPEMAPNFRAVLISHAPFKTFYLFDGMQAGTSTRNAYAHRAKAYFGGVSDGSTLPAERRDLGCGGKS
ncbi:MAG: hypothetical protein HYV27_21620 [Candidatus Hydrogenedentes bacterium]|nr:hypothetical protein [Candidatus Hydrogenedentota bacterium]